MMQPCGSLEVCTRDSATLVGQPQAGIEAGDRGELSLVSEEEQEWGEEYFL
jgi:hypothetical protein